MRRLLVKTFLAAQRMFAGAGSLADHYYLDRTVPASDDDAWVQRLVAECNQPGMCVLEIGSREVTGPSTWRPQFNRASYVGFDFHPGPNVDVVGDAHRLSTHFADVAPFDAVFSVATFEHLAAPWVVATEIARVLRVGGYVLIATHFSIGSHERPWHFFQFSDMALRVLFSPMLGFECLGAGLSNPMVGRFSRFAHPSLRYQPTRGLFCSATYFGRKVRDVPSFSWEQADIAALVGGTTYPMP